MMEERVKQGIKEIVGEENFTDKVLDLISYAKDASEHRHLPDAAVWVATKEQVSQILKLANKEKFPVIPRGAGTGLAGTAVPNRGGLVMDMARMNKIIKISIEDRLAVVQPGVVFEHLQTALAPHGFFYPPDPASGKVSTLGGNVATNAGGIKGAKYGVTKDYVLGLEVVRPDGRIMHTGSNCMKSVSGYDLTKLFVGSEGTLGVVTEITLKINPKPPLSSTAMATFEELEDTGRAVIEIMHSGIIPSVLEVVDRQTIKCMNEYTNLGLPDVSAILLAETDGHTLEEVNYQISKIIDIFMKNNAHSVRQAESAEEAEALWVARKSAYAVIARLNNNINVEDLAVPMSRLAEMLKAIEDITKKHDLIIVTVGHVGDGNLHPTICFDGTNANEVVRVEKATEEILKKAVELGGTITGEHGIGLAKAPFITFEHDEVAMDVFLSLKKLFDPNNIMNPGKMNLEGEMEAKCDFVTREAR
jgi:glycolate oxidase